MLSTLLESAVRSIGIAVVLGVALRLMRIRNPQTLSIVWTAVLFFALSMPMLMPAVKAVMISAPPATVAWIPDASSSPFLLRPLTLPTADHPTAFIDRADVAIVYAFVASILLLRLVVGLLRGHRLRRAAILLNDPWTSGCDIRVSAELAVPVTYARTILLPAEWPDWSEFKRDAIVVHERAHVWRRDFYVQLLAGIHRAVFWFSPLAWWLQGQLLKASENACDDEAIEKVGDRISYAELLLDLTKLRSHDRLVGVAMARGKTVEGRIERILRETRIAPRLSTVRRVFIVGAVVPLVGLAAGSWLVEAKPQGVSSPPAPPLSAARVLQQTIPTTAPVPAPAPQGQAAPVPVGVGALANWIEQNVPDISTDEEQAAFKALRNDETREAFITQFWLRRDPTPVTPENEFRNAYYRRVMLANQRFAIASRQGWETDRGRILVKFGEADEVESHPQGGRTSTIPFEIWRYRLIEGIGQHVVLEFVDVGRNGDYRLTLDSAEQNKLIRTNR